jgi:hypothetical protein
LGRTRVSSVGEAAGPVDSGVVLVYGSHRFGEVDAPDVDRIARGFRTRCEGREPTHRVVPRLPFSDGRRHKSVTSKQLLWKLYGNVTV